MNFRGSRGEQSGIRRPQAGRQAAGTVPAELWLVAALERRGCRCQQSCVGGGHVEGTVVQASGRALSDGSCCGIVVSMERGGDREEAGWLGLSVGGC